MLCPFNNRTFLLCCVLALVIVNTLQTSGTSQRHGNRDDSLFVLPHEKNPEPWIKQLPYAEHPLPFPPSPAKTNTLFPNINISSDTFPQNEPSVKISRKNPNRAVAAWRDFRTGVSPAVRRIGYSYTTDAGSHWSVSALIDSFSEEYPRSSDPAVGVDTAGNFYVATISINSDDNYGKIIIFRSTDQGQSFASASFAPADTGISFDDKEYIACDLVPGSPFANNLYISWTRFFSSSVGMMLTRSTDGGLTWSHSVPISDAGNEGQGSDPAVGPNGEVYVVWENPTIYFDKSTDGGLTFGIDQPTGLSSSAGFPSIAIDLSGGPRHGCIYVVATDSRFGDEDVLLTSSTDGGTTWSSPTRVNDDPIGNGKIQYWPWMAVDDAGNVNILYFDTRNTPSSNTTESYFAHSTDGGHTFANDLLSTQQSFHATPNQDVRFGDYIGIDAWRGRAIPVWTDERTGNFNMEIYSALINTPVSPITFDYRPLSFSSPLNGAQVTPGTTVSMPTAIFQNCGFRARTDSFDVKYRILFGSTVLYSSAKRIPGLGFAEKREVTFDGDFTPLTDGSYSLQAIVLASDQIPTNDTLTGTLTSSYPFSVNVGIEPRWNLVSAPVQRPDMSARSLFPASLASTTYRYYEGSYQPIDTLVPGTGYWLKFPSAATPNIGGNRVDSLSINVSRGWNLIGSPDQTVPAPSGGILEGSVYEFKNGYRIVSTLEPGKGYWLKAGADGILKLGTAAFPKTDADNVQAYAHLTLIDHLGRQQILSIQVQCDQDPDLSKYEMPPLGPSGSFDARFVSQRILEAVEAGEAGEFPIQLTGTALPLTIEWEPASHDVYATLIVDRLEVSLNRDHLLTLTSLPSRVVLRISDKRLVPTTFALHQNFPNPFNPVTEIHYDVPQAGEVLLTIYNFLGQQIATLVKEYKPPGNYTIRWDAQNIPSGLYFCKMVAGAFIQTRKMILIK